MIYFLGVVCVFVLSFIATLHFYWAFGGKWGISSVIPIKENDVKAIHPKWFATLIVALVILGFSSLYAEKIALVSLAFLPNSITNYGVLVIASIFIIRAIGDFKYVGFFKQIKTTLFAKNDTNYFSPLCLFLGVIGYLLHFSL
ncbi:DUF3995 domain-containing protein [Tenacibaculum sp. 190524A02b]|uniref:DUF3995 domain-containing protein n=1 Tax=Tenacibaculum vairaonense TaxID=3137860 RepID=A0ABM9PI63_9FLAO